MSVDAATPIEDTGADAANADYSRIFIAAIAPSGALEFNDQTVENGGYADVFQRLTDLGFQSSHLNASVTQEGFVALLAVEGATGNLTYICESRDPETKTRFADPVDLGRPTGGSDYLDSVLIRGATGRQNVFLTSAAAGNAIWWKYQNPNRITEETITTTPPGTDTPVTITVPVETPPSQIWSNWQQLPGALCSLTATQNADGRIFLAGINGDGVAYLTLQSPEHPAQPQGWESWQNLSGGLSGFEQLLCGIDGASIVHIFARIGDTIYMRTQTEVGGSDFTGWMLFASFAEDVSCMALTNGPNNGLYLVAQVGTGAGSPVYAKFQRDAGGDIWSTPQVIAKASGDSDLVLQANADNRLSLFARDHSTGAISYLTQSTLAHWAASWVSLGGGFTRMALTRDITRNPS